MLHSSTKIAKSLQNSFAQNGTKWPEPNLPSFSLINLKSVIIEFNCRYLHAITLCGWDNNANFVSEMVAEQ